MKWRWWWTMLLVSALMSSTSLHTTTASDRLEALSIDNEVLNLLTPLLGDLHLALQGFIDVGKIGLGVARFINFIADQVFNSSLVDMNFGSYIPSADRKILAMFELLSKRLDEMEHGVHGISSSLRGLADGMQDMVRWEIALDSLEEYIRPITNQYRYFLHYQKLKEQVEDHTLREFANSIVSHDTNSIMSMMAYLHSMAAPEASQRTSSLLQSEAETLSVLNDPKDTYRVSERVSRKMILREKQLNSKSEQFALRPSVFRMLHNTLKNSDHCRLTQSTQQMINGLYMILALSEARGFAMLEFAYMILRVYHEGNFTVEQELSERMYLQYSADILQEAKTVLLETSREFYKCDPKTHVQGDTYIQLTELLQGYVENEVDMNSGASCSGTCKSYQHATSEGCYMPGSQYCGKHRRCRGTIHDCKFYDADADVCISSNPYRRYDSIKYESGMVLGSTRACEGTTMKVDSWWRFLYHCSYCLCLCDDEFSPSTDRYVSLVSALSDTRNNKVVTGVKFIKQRRVIHMQVQQGQALPQGQVNSSTIQWVNVEPISIISTAYNEGTHYKKLSYEDRNIDLDLLEAPEEHVITGVRFRMLGSHLNLEVQITPVNFTSGKLEPFKSYWISNDNTPIRDEDPRKELKLHQPGDPTKHLLPAQIDSVPDTFMRFGPTDRWKDVAQLTVPFFDSQSVAPTPSYWISGVELYHKGHTNTGGYLGLKVITYNLTLHMEGKDVGPKVVNLPTVPSQ